MAADHQSSAHRSIPATAFDDGRRRGACGDLAQGRHSATACALITGAREGLAPLVLTGPAFGGSDGSAFGTYREALHAYVKGADPEPAAQRALQRAEQAKDWGARHAVARNAPRLLLFADRADNPGFVEEFRERSMLDGESASWSGGVMSLSVRNVRVLATGRSVCVARNPIRCLALASKRAS